MSEARAFLRPALFVVCLGLVVLAMAIAARGEPARDWGPPPSTDDAGRVSVRDFGAVCDGNVDDSAALQRAFRDRHYRVELPAGATCAFRQAPLVLDRPYGAIAGAGMWGTSRLLYTGPETDTDLLQVGSGVSKETGLTSTGYTVLRGFAVESATRMTGGYAIHQMNTQFVSYEDVALGRQQDPVNLWNGFHFDQSDYTIVDHFFITAQNDCLAVSGHGAERNPATAPQYDLWIDHGKIGGCHVGVHVGGGFDGAFFDHVQDTNNDYDVVIDNALSPHPNQEVLFGPQFFADFARWDSVLIDDPLCEPRIYCIVTFGGPIIHALAQTAVATGSRAAAQPPRDSGNGIHIVRYPNGTVVVQSPYMQAHVGAAIFSEDPCAYLVASSSTLVSGNGGGVWSTKPWSRVLSRPLFLRNTGANTLRVLSPAPDQTDVGCRDRTDRTSPDRRKP